MGLFEDLFGTQQQTSQTVNQYPLFVEEALRNSWLRADQISRQPYTTYPEERIAGFTPDQQAAFDLTRQNLGSWMPFLGTAAATAEGGINPLLSASGYLGQGTTTWPQADVGAYMNPFISQVLDLAAGRAGDRFQTQLNQTSADAVRAGAFGGSRHGVLEGQMYDDFNRQLNEMYTTGLAGAYTNAQNIFGSDMNRLLQAGQASGTLAGQYGNLANIFGNLGSQTQQLGLRDVASLGAVGEAQQALDQRNLDLGYQDFLNQRDWDLNRTNWFNQIIRGLPSTQQGTSTQLTGGNVNPLAAGVGTAGSIFSAGKTFGWW